ncbi:MAG: prenyltransferase/squalene oxidase repeat-containing protein [Pirellulaceae bacterium]|nr:prenyltransferase/squalene oxidase repeat-containing protein [Pirellulaceae bacterium]
MRTFSLLLVTVLLSGLTSGLGAQEKALQYEAEGIEVSAATAEEPLGESFSLKAALDYLEKGSLAWSRKRNCVSCHTNGTYMQMRPELTPLLGKPTAEMREFYVKRLGQLARANVDVLKKGLKPTQVAYVAIGLASWDAHVTGELSAETRSGLDLMLKVQSEDGSWNNIDCWPPFESSSYHGATVAATALALAPGYLEELKKDGRIGQVEKLKTYLRQTTPPHDYGRLLLLWASTRMDGLLDKQQQQEIVQMIFSHQQADGGWSMRTFSTPEAWGGGSRAEKLRAEPEYKNPPSDGHQTGLAVIVLRDAGIPAGDPRIEKAVNWILANQRTSGRWWTRSLNTDTFHFITYSGTMYPLLALYKCNKLPKTDSGGD